MPASVSGNDAVNHLPVAILCGGRGTRLRPTTDVIPKALVLLNGRPILDYMIDFYRSHGLGNLVLCIGYRGEDLRRHYAKLPKGVSIEFSDAGEDASMLQRVWTIRDRICPRLMVSYGDTFADLDLAGMVDAHLARQALATIAVARIRNPFGLVAFNAEGWATSFVEKPWLYYYIGYFLLEDGALNYVTPEMLASPDGQGLVHLFTMLAGARRLAVFEHQGLQITFNTESERRRAEEDLGRFYTLPEDTWQD